jgi:DNA-binding LacI/PurR family transcriptional regulator
VLNQRGNVHPDTVKLVREALIRAKYEAPAMRLGRNGSSGSAGEAAVSLSAYALVVPEISNGMYSTLLQGFGDAASAHYHQPIVSNTADNLYKQGDEILQLIHKRVAGVAIVPVASAPTPLLHIEAIQAANIPVVLLHRDVSGSTAPLVALPLEEVGYRAGQALLDRGHARIALFTTPEGPSSNLHRSGLRRAMGERGLALSDDAVFACEGAAPFSLPTLEAAIDRATARIKALPADRRPTAIYTTNDVIAEVVYMRLMRDGVRLPQDVSLISFGAQQRIGAIAPRLSCIVVDERVVGAKAVEVLGRERSRDAASAAAAASEPRRIENVPISLAEGETIGPAMSPS